MTTHTEKEFAPPVVLGWFKPQRPGELDLTDDDDRVECCECGCPLDEIWLAALSNGAIYGPVCSGCARSD